MALEKEPFQMLNAFPTIYNNHIINFKTNHSL